MAIIWIHIKDISPYSVVSSNKNPGGETAKKALSFSTKYLVVKQLLAVRCNKA